MLIMHWKYSRDPAKHPRSQSHPFWDNSAQCQASVFFNFGVSALTISTHHQLTNIIYKIYKYCYRITFLVLNFFFWHVFTLPQSCSFPTYNFWHSFTSTSLLSFIKRNRSISLDHCCHNWLMPNDQLALEGSLGRASILVTSHSICCLLNSAVLKMNWRHQDHNSAF